MAVGGWGSRVLNRLKYNFLFKKLNAPNSLKSKINIFKFFTLWSPKHAGWVGGVRYLGLSPKKNGCFFDTFPNPDFCITISKIVVSAFCLQKIKETSSYITLNVQLSFLQTECRNGDFRSWDTKIRVN